MIVKTIYVEITNICNLNCRSCYNRSGLNRNRREILPAQLEGIINQFLPYGLNRVLISGGEPTMHSNLGGILDVFDKYPELSYGVVTNGTNHHAKLISFINSHRNVTLQVSLDGSCETQNAKTRGVGHFDAVVEFIHKISSPHTKPLLKMVISQRNFDDVEKFYRFAVSLHCIPEFAFLYRSGNGSDTWDDQALSIQQKFNVLRTIKRLNTECHINAFVPLSTSTCPYVTGTDQMSLCIKVDGSIQPCQMLYMDAFTLGNVFTFNSAFFAKRLDQIVLLAKTRCQTNYTCNRCLLHNICSRGCIANAVSLYGTPFVKDGECELRKLQFLYFDYLSKEK